MAWSGDSNFTQLGQTAICIDLCSSPGGELWIHDSLPALPVPIWDLKGDWSACAHRGPDPREDRGLVLLDLHPSPSASAPLPPGQLSVNFFGHNREPRRQALYNCHQSPAVGFSSCQKTQTQGLASSSFRNAGVISIIISLSTVSVFFLWNNLPKKGIFPKIGTEVQLSSSFFSTRPLRIAV